MGQDNKQIARRWFEEVWNQGKESTVDELLSADARAFGLTGAGTEIHGPSEFKPFMRNMLGAFPDFHVEIEDMVSEDDRIAVRFRLTGTHKGDSLGFPATGKKIDLTAMTFIHISGGKFIRGWNNWDQLGLLNQLNVSPTSVSVDQFLEARG